MPDSADDILKARTMVTRRGFFPILAGALAGLAFLPQRLLAGLRETSRKKTRWGMVIDLDKCTGCQGCAAACRSENNVPAAGPADTEKGRSIFWMNQLEITEGEYPHLRRQLLPTPCNHCEHPPCIKVCPVGATSQSEDGITQQIPERCIGCRLCAVACPFTRRYFNWSKPSWPETERKYLNPDVAPRHHGVMEKCLFCHHRIRAARERADAEGRALTDADVRRLPACAQSCPADAIAFGNLNDPDSEVSRLAESPRAFRLLEELGTHPKVIYLREAKWLQ